MDHASLLFSSARFARSGMGRAALKNKADLTRVAIVSLSLLDHLFIIRRFLVRETNSDWGSGRDLFSSMILNFTIRFHGFVARR